MAWLFSFVLMAIQKGQDSPPPGRQLQAVPPPHLALLPLHRRHLAHHLRQLEQHWLLLPLCHPQLPLAQAQAGGPQLHRHLPRAAAGEFGHQVDILSKRQDHPQLAFRISGFFFLFFALYVVYDSVMRAVNRHYKVKKEDSLEAILLALHLPGDEVAFIFIQ